jgi:hypothetical protein
MKMQYLCVWRNSDELLFCALLCLMIFGGTRSVTAQENMLAAGQGQRFMYTLDCSAELDKFNALTGQHIDHTELWRKTRQVQAEVCSMSSALYLPQENVFLTIQKTSGFETRSKKQSYLLLRFQLPDLRFLGSVSMPVLHDDQDIPRLEFSSMWVVQVITREKAYALAGNKLIPVPRLEKPRIAGSHAVEGHSDMQEMDISGYDISGLKLDPQVKALEFRPLTDSGTVVLIEYMNPNEGSGYAGYAAVDTEAKRIVALHPGFATAENDYFTLAPGGKAVLFQEYKDHAGTDRLALLDTSTGAVLLTFSDPAMIQGGVWAITPSGVGVLSSCCVNDSTQQFHAISLGRDFSALPMRDHGETRKNWYFYSER